MSVPGEPVCIYLFRKNPVFYLPAFEISRSCRTASEGKNVGIATKGIQLIIEALFSKYTLQRLPEGRQKRPDPLLCMIARAPSCRGSRAIKADRKIACCEDDFRGLPVSSHITHPAFHSHYLFYNYCTSSTLSIFSLFSQSVGQFHLAPFEIRGLINI